MEDADEVIGSVEGQSRGRRTQRLRIRQRVDLSDTLAVNVAVPVSDFDR